ncbi:MAG: bifunctional nicotinamidase/pyrazinamidase [Verrucomicrobia bacterium]|nr:bifunctional nicotinamidase/pyrazinamidase [Verrucomicrobiota bacterium]
MLGLFGSKTKALIIVDVQNDFAPGGALAVPKGDEVVPFINSVLGEYKIVVATKDWHPKNHCSFASTHPGKKVGDRVDLEDGSQLLWPDHCVQGSPGAEFVKGLDAGKIQKTFQKGIDPDIDSYSGLFDNGFKRDTGLAKYLKDNKASEVAIVGLATDYTVKFTALDCKKQGFNVTVLRKGCRALNIKPDDEEKALAEMRAAGVTVK